MEKLRVGDRVEFVGRYPPKWTGATAIVGEIKYEGEHVRVHFDDPAREANQSYSAGWSASSFRLIDDEPVIEEDWS